MDKNHQPWLRLDERVVVQCTLCTYNIVQYLWCMDGWVVEQYVLPFHLLVFLSFQQDCNWLCNYVALPLFSLFRNQSLKKLELIDGRWDVCWTMQKHVLHSSLCRLFAFDAHSWESISTAMGKRVLVQTWAREYLYRYGRESYILLRHVLYRRDK